MSRVAYSSLAALCLFPFGCGGPSDGYTVVVIPKGMTH
jgi:hypothetical protein